MENTIEKETVKFTKNDFLIIAVAFIICLIGGMLSSYFFSLNYIFEEKGAESLFFWGKTFIGFFGTFFSIIGVSLILLFLFDTFISICSKCDKVKHEKNFISLKNKVKTTPIRMFMTFAYTFMIFGPPAFSNKKIDNVEVNFTIANFVLEVGGHILGLLIIGLVLYFIFLLFKFLIIKPFKFLCKKLFLETNNQTDKV